MKEKIEAILFDLDGTLWDSADGVLKTWNMVIAKHPECKRELLTAEELGSYFGLPMKEIGNRMFSNINEEERDALMEECCKLENDYLAEHGGILFPKLAETLAILHKDYKLYIVSNCQSGYIEAFLDYYKFHDLVEDIECFGNNNKPKADNIALICERNNIAKEDAVYVGDIQGDYDSATAAGVKFIHAAYGFGTINTEVEKIQAFNELPEVMKKVF